MGTQLVELPTFKDPQPIFEEITSSNEEDETSEEGTESLVWDEDFKVFYRTDKTKEEASCSCLAATLINDNQEAIVVPEAMVIKKRLLDLLSLLESYVGTTTFEIPVVPRPSAPIPPPPPQAEPAKKKRKRDKQGGKGSIEEGKV